LEDGELGGGFADFLRDLDAGCAGADYGYVFAFEVGVLVRPV
jgi:hypothetical protein